MSKLQLDVRTVIKKKKVLGKEFLDSTGTAKREIQVAFALTCKLNWISIYNMKENLLQEC